MDCSKYIGLEELMEDLSYISLRKYVPILCHDINYMYSNIACIVPPILKCNLKISPIHVNCTLRKQKIFHYI